YITEWKSLPDKTFINTNDFSGGDPSNNYNGLQNNAAKFPFPFSGPNPSRSANIPLPYLAFDSEGRCIRVEREETGAGKPIHDIDLRVARGAILYSRLSDGSVDPNTFDVQQIPPNNATNNTIHVDLLTGRANRIELQLQ